MILRSLIRPVRNVTGLSRGRPASHLITTLQQSAPSARNAIVATTRPFAVMSSLSEQDTVSFDLKDARGNTTKVHVKPSYPSKPKAVANLISALPELITDAVMPTEPVSYFSTTGWDLDESNDTIHRYVELASESDVQHAVDAIESAAQELNHDPHIHRDGTRLTISCTTHVPAGLSMKDVKLARKINEILAGMELVKRREDDEAEVLTQRQRAREHNMEEVKRAKERCDCG